MSLRLKIALGVLAATTVMAVALGLLALEAKKQLDESAQRQHQLASQRFEELSQRYHEQNLRAVQTFVVGSLQDLLLAPHTEILPALRRERAGVAETAIVEPLDDGDVSVQVLRPAGSRMTLTEEEAEFAHRVRSSGEYEFLGNVLFYPWNPDLRSDGQYVVRLKLDIPRIEMVAPERAPNPDLGPFVVAAFTTLALAMLAVFVLLMFALRRFVLAPLGNVLEDSKRIVKGGEGLEVHGFTGGGNDIETLVAAFNAMFSELKAYQSDLEGKVSTATRTIEKQQQSLVIAQRLAATGTLAAGLAHEVNNPLSGMLNAARRLRKREDLDERSLDYVGLIEEGLQRIEMLMKQILDFSRRRDMKPERFNAESAFRRALALVRHRIDQKKIRLEEDFRQDLPPIYGNEEEIGQVLMNLLINASDASPAGGAVRITMAPSQAGGVLMTVEDSGDGVPLELHERIFDPFFTTKEPGKGTGLGLAIVHTIVSNHGGSVRVENSSTLGGASFIIELPAAEKRESTRRQAKR